MSLRVSSAGSPVLLTGVFSALIALSGCGSEQSNVSDNSQSTGTPASHGSLPSSVAATTHKTSPSLPATAPQVPPSIPPAPSPPPQTPPPPQAPPLPASHYEWKKDSFEHSGEFSDRCVYPIAEGEYPGTMLDELFAWRDIINKHYLYQEELVDLDPHRYVRYGKNKDHHFDIMTNKDSYIRKMISSIEAVPVDWAKERTPTGGMRDELFKVYRTTETTSIPYRFDIDFEVVSDTVPRKYIVRYADSDIIKRGDKLLEVDGRDFVHSQDENDIETMMTTIKGRQTEDAVTFVFSDRDGGPNKIVKLKPSHWSNWYTEPINQNVIETDTGKVGYLRVGGGGTTAARYEDSIASLKESKVTDLVVDFRYHSSNYIYPHVSLKHNAALAFMIAGPDKINSRSLWGGGDVYSNYGRFRPMTEDEIDYTRTNTTLTEKEIEDHRVFSGRHHTELSDVCPVSFIYRSKRPGERFVKGWNCSLFYHRWAETYAHIFYSVDYAKPFSTLKLNRVFVLVSEHSCKRTELFINALRGVDVEVILIGQKTCGNPYARSFIENCGVVVEIIRYHFVNEELFWDYGDGFKPSNSKTSKGVSLPGCYVEDDFTNDLGDKEEAMLSAALQYRKSKTCPTVP